MATELIVATAFAGYTRGQILTDPATIAAILAGPYSDQVRVVIPTTGGSGSGNSISGVPSAVQVGAVIAGTYQSASVGQFVCIRLAGTDLLPRAALPSLSGSLPTLLAASAGVGTLAMYAAATGGLPLFETGAIAFTLSAPTGVVLPPNAPFLGSDAYGVPTIITLGPGLSIVNGVLTLIGNGTGGGTTTPPTVAPFNSSLPTISGTAQQGQALTATAGTWSGSPTYAYQWLRAGSPISGATSSSYTLTSTDVGAMVMIRITATNSAGAASATSAATATVTSSMVTPPTTSTRARFAQDVATAGTSSTAAALFASMTQLSGTSSDRNGTLTTSADPTKYTWVAVLASAAGSGVHFFDGTGYGGFNGAASTSIYSGPDADPTTICQTYTDGSGNVWNLYRSSGHSVALTFTLS